MENAIDELKAKGDFVTKSNNEAGVAYGLEHYLVGERRKLQALETFIKNNI